MSVAVKHDKNLAKHRPLWNIKGTQDIRNKIPEQIEAPTINYDWLTKLCDIDGLKSRDKAESTKEAHEIFMQNYKHMFVQKPKRTGYHIPKAIENETQSGSLSNLSNLAVRSSSSEILDRKLPAEDVYTHNIKDYLPLVHKVKKTENTKAVQEENIRTLRQLLKKYPFERNAAENEKIYSILKTFDFFKENVEAPVLKELSVLAQLETWNEENFAVYGKTGIHMILKGSVLAQFTPYLIADSEGFGSPHFQSTVNSTTKPKKLSVGDFFGTWLSLDDAYIPELSVVTAECNCEFLKITTNDYKRVKEQIQQREHKEKMNLLLSCEQYMKWPKQPLTSLAETIEWMTYPPNTVLMSEGYKSPFIGFILSGECHVLRQIEVLHTFKNGKKEKRTKQVVMGKLGPYNSFAEISLLLDEPITCSIVTATKLQLGVIRPEKLNKLDEVTKQLLRQSNKKTYGDLTKEDIQNEYLEQELKREWNEFKHAQVLDVINTRGIRPGFGKWAK
ncbi:cyclic nucleotide-binding domain-containing protein 1-like [Physella acuta]|uniref:cyclic nucleotide-binding domain-containing protein 1-like n=1 Tax=Physella acuta TaxID=109671 RepID=UPI0027DEA125|nr:cyclic nucleotide-binding domain-containing protein 1-like [Physella acuta]